MALVGEEFPEEVSEGRGDAACSLPGCCARVGPQWHRGERGLVCGSWGTGDRQGLVQVGQSCEDHVELQWVLWCLT